MTILPLRAAEPATIADVTTSTPLLRDATDTRMSHPTTDTEPVEDPAVEVVVEEEEADMRIDVTPARHRREEEEEPVEPRRRRRELPPLRPEVAEVPTMTMSAAGTRSDLFFDPLGWFETGALTVAFVNPSDRSLLDSRTCLRARSRIDRMEEEGVLPLVVETEAEMEVETGTADRTSPSNATEKQSRKKISR